MNLDSYIEETMDEAMRSYTDSETYKTGRTQINEKIAAFRDKLTSKEQINKFNQLLDTINDADAAYSTHAYIAGVKAGIFFQEQLAKQ